jgi:hypothetical protein
MSDAIYAWYVGTIQGLGDCVFQAPSGLGDEPLPVILRLRNVCRLVMRAQGVAIVQAPIGVQKRADVCVQGSAVLSFAPADSQIANDAANACGISNIVTAHSVPDLDKAPKLRLV